MRACIRCGDEIRESMGFVFAGDLFVRGESTARELCGRCGILAWDLTENGIIEWEGDLC